MANMPVNLELEQLRGRYGKTLSPLRPSGSPSSTAGASTP